MSIPEDDPVPPARCPECRKNDRTQEATDRERAQFPGKPWWCLRCSLPFTGSQIEAQNYQAARAARAAERGDIAATNRRGAERLTTTPKETER